MCLKTTFQVLSMHMWLGILDKTTLSYLKTKLCWVSASLPGTIFFPLVLYFTMSSVSPSVFLIVFFLLWLGPPFESIFLFFLAKLWDLFFLVPHPAHSPRSIFTTAYLALLKVAALSATVCNFLGHFLCLWMLSLQLASVISWEYLKWWFGCTQV